MPLKKLLFKAGVNRENTRYTSENGWYDGDKVRFRQGTPEKIGGWTRFSSNTFLGICRSLWNWVTLSGLNIIGVGTSLKFYLENGGAYYDITPIRASVSLTNPFDITNNSSIVFVTDANGGFYNNDFVTFYGSSAIGNLTILGEYQITVIDSTHYTINLGSSVSITIASPATLTSQFQLANNTPVVLTTTGSLPYPFTPNVIYYVVNTSGYTFQLAATVGGAALSTFGSTQSGAHTATPKATSTVAAGGGTVRAVYQINTGSDIQVPLAGWGAGYWGSGYWGIGTTNPLPLRLWSQNNFGQDLIFGPRGGPMYYWSANVGVAGFPATITNANPGVVTGVALTAGTAITLTTTGQLPTGLNAGVIYYVVNPVSNTFNLATTPGGTAINTTGTQSGTHRVSSRGIPVSSLNGASSVPLQQNSILISDTSRFVFVFGCNPYLETTFDPMEIRWSDQESVTDWAPSATNQAGSIRLSHGSEIITAIQSRQEIVVFTDSSVYSLQYLGPPLVWSSQLLGDNISIVSQNAVSLASGTVFWMGVDKFYKYDGRVQTLRCDLRQYIYSDINRNQFQQIVSGTNEGFNEVWWFYCSENSNTVDRYVIYNYLEDIWYYGQLGRTAWLDSGLRSYPVGATYVNNLVNHEDGVDDETTATPVSIEAYITSAEFDLDDGHNFAFVWRILPDLTFRGSNVNNPTATMYLKPLSNSGSGYTTPPSVGGYASHSITRTAVVPIEQYTGQIYTRARGRQFSIELRSTELGVQWQLGSPRLDIRPDGRR
jgi:hypothetical protein